MWLSVFINACVLNRFIPSWVLAVIIVPLLKDKHKDPTVHSSYRPITIAIIVSKVIEKALLHRLQDYLHSVDSQFSYKKSPSTETWV